MDETTPLLRPPNLSETNTPLWRTWSSARVLSIFPVVAVMAFNAGFQRSVLYELLPKLVGGPERFRAIALAAGALASFLSTPFWSALSDRYGRRLILLVGVLGAILSNLFLIFICRTRRSPMLYLPGIVIEGFLGGYTTFRAMMYAFTADSLSADPRLAVFSILQGVIHLAYWAPGYSGFRMRDYDIDKLLHFVNILQVVLVITFFYVLCCVPESLALQQHPQTAAAETSNGAIRPLSGIRIWILRNPFRASSFFALALCLYSIIPAVEEGYGTNRFRRDIVSDPGYVDMLLKAGRYFIVIPVLALDRPRNFYYFTPLQWSFRLAFLSPLFIIGGLSLCFGLQALVAQLMPEGCGMFCFGFFVIFVLNWFLLIIIPNLCNVGGVPVLYSLLAGCYEMEGRRGELGLLIGRLGVLQSFAEVVIGELENYLASYWILILGYAVAQLGTAGLLWCSRSRIAS